MPLGAVEVCARAAPPEGWGLAAASRRKAPPAAGGLRLRQCLGLAAGFGLATGLAEAAVLAVRRFALGCFIRHGDDVFWLAPLVDLALFAVLGLLYAAAARLWPRAFSARLAVFAFAFLGWFSVLFMFHPRLHKYAGALLAAGLATQTARLLAPRLRRFDPHRRRAVCGMLGLTGGLALGTRAWRWAAEHEALAGLPAPARPDLPNVLLLVLDTVRARNLSLYGYDRPTSPGLERLAQEGVCFERALSAAPWTLPSHASMFTGRLPYELSADRRTPLDGAHPTLAEVLAAAGYLTAGFVANTFYCSRECGLARGFAHYEDYRPSSPGQLTASSTLARYAADNVRVRRLVGSQQRLGRKSAAELSAEFLGWLPRPGGRPFFAFLNYFDAHSPYLPPEPFPLRFGTTIPQGWPILKPVHAVAPEKIQALKDTYDGSLAYLDHQVGLLLGELRRRGALDNTLVIITADHGEEFGDHGVFGHGRSLYLDSVHVPLLLLFPGRVPPGQRVAQPASLRDLPATVTDLIGLEGAKVFPGASLARHWGDGPAGRGPEVVVSEVRRNSDAPAWAPVSKGDVASLVVGRWRYIKTGDQREELYDLHTDAEEQHDQSRSETGRRQVQHMRALLRDYLERGVNP